MKGVELTFIQEGINLRQNILSNLTKESLNIPYFFSLDTKVDKIAKIAVQLFQEGLQKMYLQEKYKTTISPELFNLQIIASRNFFYSVETIKLLENKLTKNQKDAVQEEEL